LLRFFRGLPFMSQAVPIGGGGGGAAAGASSPRSEKSSEGSDSEGDMLDQATKQLLRQAPLCARIGEALSRTCSTLPPEVGVFFEGLGARVAHAKLLKISFHATFLVDLAPPLVFEGTAYSQVIVQVLGVTCGDKPFWGQLQGASIHRAHELAAAAGLRVPRIFGVGSCVLPGLGPQLDFVTEEFVETQTVEDKVSAPREQWHGIVNSAVAQLQSRPVIGMSEGDPLPNYVSLQTQLQWLLTHVQPWDTELSSALTLFAESVVASPPSPRPAVLLHQDLNTGNVLCSEQPRGSGRWALDAVIDWESAVVADPRSLSDDEPFRTAQHFALVVKGAELAEQFVRETLPRCELEELIEGYTRSAEALSKAGWLRVCTWAERVEAARTYASGSG